jgi:hypothetical protein
MARRRGLRHIHHSPLFWFAVLMCLAAIFLYIASDDLAWSPFHRGSTVPLMAPAP